MSVIAEFGRLSRIEVLSRDARVSKPKKKRIGVEVDGRASWGAGVLRPYTDMVARENLLQTRTADVGLVWALLNLNPQSNPSRRFDLGLVESKPAPFQKAKGCGTQLPRRRI